MTTYRKREGRLSAEKNLTVEIFMGYQMRSGRLFPYPRADWYTPDSLLQILPQLRPTDRRYTTLPFQMGTILLKDGTVRNWRAASSESLLLYDDNAHVERLYVVPGSDDDIGD